MKKMFLTISTLVLTAAAFASVPGNNKVIYGDDNRLDVYETNNNMYLELAKSTAAQIPNSSLSAVKNGEVTVLGRTLQSRNICAKEKFSAQLSAARCSGFLVGSNLLVTAGHCITNDSDCSSYAWVFDFKMNAANQSAMTVKSDNVFHCSKIIARAQDSSQNDYALIQLDRAVADRQPLQFRKEGKIADNAKLVVIGHPSGLPTKIADGAEVRSNSHSLYFVANTDTYGGNSGSAVFDANTGIVEGILVRGEQDYVYDYSLGCQVSKVCANNACRGEDITRITNFKVLKRVQ